MEVSKTMGKNNDDNISLIFSGSQENSDLYSNVGQNYVQTTEDKLKICLTDHKNLLEAKSKWQTPASIVVSIGLALFTADFKDAFGLGKDVWQAVFVIAFCLSLMWLIITLIRIPWKKEGADEIIEKIKGGGKM
jgi:hypothetical protein